VGIPLKRRGTNARPAMVKLMTAPDFLGEKHGRRSELIARTTREHFPSILLPVGGTSPKTNRQVDAMIRQTLNG
jgi:hypothetical protein